MPKRSINRKKSKNFKKYSKKNKTTKRKHIARKGSRKFSKTVKGGDLPPNQRGGPPEPNEEMFVVTEEDEGEDIGQQINRLILEIINLGFIEQNTGPVFVYTVMVRILELWNYAVDLRREEFLTEDNLNQMRVLINAVYDGAVRVTSQEGAFIVDQEGEEPLPEIINRRSSAILSDLFDYVANIQSQDENIRINDRIEIPDYDTAYGQIPDEDNPDFQSDDEEEEEGSQNDAMDTEQ